MARIELTLTPPEADVEVVLAGMRAYEQSVLPDLPDESEDVTVYAFARSEDGAVIGGVRANVFWNGVEIDTLWVADEVRRSGLGTSLLRTIEEDARKRGAVVAYLKTVMAREFYERLGYTVFGVLEDRPIGTLLFHMKRRLDEG